MLADLRRRCRRGSHRPATTVASLVAASSSRSCSGHRSAWTSTTPMALTVNEQQTRPRFTTCAGCIQPSHTLPGDRVLALARTHREPARARTGQASRYAYPLSMSFGDVANPRPEFGEIVVVVLTTPFVVVPRTALLDPTLDDVQIAVCRERSFAFFGMRKSSSGVVNAIPQLVLGRVSRRGSGHQRSRRGLRVFEACPVASPASALPLAVAGYSSSCAGSARRRAGIVHRRARRGGLGLHVCPRPQPRQTWRWLRRRKRQSKKGGLAHGRPHKIVGPASNRPWHPIDQLHAANVSYFAYRSEYAQACATLRGGPRGRFWPQKPHCLRLTARRVRILRHKRQSPAPRKTKPGGTIVNETPDQPQPRARSPGRKSAPVRSRRSDLGSGPAELQAGSVHQHGRSG